jgi:origin recognition complex subunit 2
VKRLFRILEGSTNDRKQRDQKQVIDLCVVIHNLDGEALRGEKSQALLARLAAIPEVMMIATVDHINAPVLWDAAKISQYNFLWHDLTTFEQYTTETAYDDPLALGRNRSTVGTKGAKYVLASLTANARALFQLLAAQQLEVMTEDTSAGGALGTIHHGVEFKLFYKRCVEQFIVSNELNFRTMLGEFVEHKMVIITKDQTGIETIYIPFTKEALEQAIEDIADM